MVKDSRALQQLPSEDLEEFNAPPSKGLNLRPFLRTLQRQALLVTGVAGVVMVASLLTGGKEPPIYEGSFRLLVEPVTSEAKMSEPTTLTRSGGGLPDDRVFSLDYPTQLQILQSPGMLSAIAEQVQTQNPKFSLNQLKEGLTVQRIGEDSFTKTKIIEVIYKGENPKEVDLVLRKTAEKYLKYSLDERKTRISEGIKFIEDQLPELQNRVNQFQGQLQVLQQRYTLIDPKAQGSELFEQVRKIADEQLESQRQLQEHKILYANLQKQLELTPDQALAASALSQDPNRVALLQKLQEVESQIATEAVRFTNNSPNIQALQEKRQNLLTLMNQETQRILGRNATSKASNPQVLSFQNSVRVGLIDELVKTANQIQVLEARTRALAETRNAFERQAQQFPIIARQYNDIDRKLEITNQTLNQLLTQRETLRVEAAQKNVPWELISEPQIERDAAGNPVAAPQSNRKKLMMGVGMGVALGVLAAILLERFRNIFYTVEDIKDAIELPLLGVIPLDQKKEKTPKSMALLKWMSKIDDSNQNTSAFVEAFDSLYANLRFLYSAPPVRSLAVCSALAGDGKSKIALHLAIAAAEAGQRVLLVDANLRCPQLHLLLDLPNHRGLCDLLNHKLSPNVFIERYASGALARSHQTDNLFVLTAGQPLPDSPKQLGSPGMQHLADELQSNFDLVIYDTPNLLSFMDASFITTHTDGILLVVGVKQTKKSAVMQAISQINTFRLPTLGVVANYGNQKLAGASSDRHQPLPKLSEKMPLNSHQPSLPEMNSKSI
ncbi:MAG TPA: capsular biosynthesis protein [Cyanobacteria bacterium UBA11371]|nr:capsular biosynthesis protein [Cyanobacteria bacterium UBA11371]